MDELKPGKAQSSTEQAGAGQPPFSILVVDDEPGMLSFLQRALAQRYGQVDTASSVEQAVPKLHRRLYDLIILDISLPGRSGIEWLHDLRDDGFAGDVILITAYADLDTAIDALRAGASDFLLKPFSVAQMVNGVARCFERSRLRRENFVLRREIEKRSTAVDGVICQSDLLVAVFGVLWARQVFHPIERMHATMNAIEDGDGAARVGPIDNADEVGDLAQHFDRLLERQQAQALALQRRDEALDGKVAQRTAELEEVLANLRSTQGKLITQEKMAAIGQLTAGVAHEINNPIAVIQGNLEVAREVLGEHAKPVEPELRLILDQVHRIRLIITKLLQFARPQEYVGYLEPVSAQQQVADCLLLVDPQGKGKLRPPCSTASRVDCAASTHRITVVRLSCPSSATSSLIL